MSNMPSILPTPSHPFVTFSIGSLLPLPFLCASFAAPVEDLGKEFTPDPTRTVPGLFHLVPKNEVLGGNTSIRNESATTLQWKGEDSTNGTGYFQRNRDLGQVFNVPPGHDLVPRSLVLRTSRGHNAIMQGAPGAPLYVQFFEVHDLPGDSARINENGTPVGTRATHGFNPDLNRADDFVEGVRYTPIARFEVGPFPDIEPTTQFAYRRPGNEPHGEQPGHLRYFRIHLPPDHSLVLTAGQRYAFLVGFSKPGQNRGLALAITSTVHEKAPPAFNLDANGLIIWGIRREGNGRLPPTMFESPDPPKDPAKLQTAIEDAIFPANHWEKIPPTSDGFPDVDTYRTLEYVIEVEPAN